MGQKMNNISDSYYDEDGVHEECGVFGVYDIDGGDVASTIYYGLFALQHRGQESCGIAVSDTNGTSDSLSLGILLCQSVSFVGLLILYLSGSSHLKTLLCTGMSLGLDLYHCEFLLFTSMPSVK